jgi:hypothetical protein
MLLLCILQDKAASQLILRALRTLKISRKRLKGCRQVTRQLLSEVYMVSLQHSRGEVIAGLSFALCRDVATGEIVTHETDAVVFAVGITGMQKIVRANPALGSRPEFRRMMNLRGIDVVSTRLWLDKRVATQFPANVLAGFDENMGSTYFNLNDLHVRSALCGLPLLNDSFCDS